MPPSKSPVMPAPEGEDLSRAEYAYVRIRQAIRDGNFKPGQRMRETELAEKFAVSRTPIREAIRRLSGEGLIEDVAGRGLAVTQFTVAQVRELYFLRAVLEGAAASQAAQFASPSEIKAMEEIHALSRSAVDQPGETARLNLHFHRAIHAAARNQYLTSALEQLADSLSLLPGTTFEVPGRAAVALNEHRDIIAAIKKHDVAKAEAAARSHIAMACDTRISMMFRS
ncbi:MAG: GntR family transcriptional regulator [Tardiphaga sp.]|nr:GntR family transcriptional regulator [Tardiphaga sp.]